LAEEHSSSENLYEAENQLLPIIDEEAHLAQLIEEARLADIAEQQRLADIAARKRYQAM